MFKKQRIFSTIEKRERKNSNSKSKNNNPYAVKPKQTKFFFGYSPDDEEIDERIKELQDYKLSQGRFSKRDKTKAQRRYYYRRLLKQELEKDNRNVERMNQLIREIETNNSEFDEELLIKAKEYLEK